MTDADLFALATQFQLEGDDLTANAILVQLRARETEVMAKDELNELARIKAKADGYCLFNGFDRAIPLYVQIKVTYEQRLGVVHARTRASLADLGQCLFQDFQYAASLDVWSRLLRIQKTVDGSDRRLTRRAQRMQKKCESALALATSTRNLSMQLKCMFGNFCAPNVKRYAQSADRLFRVASKLEAMGKSEGAKALMTRWIKARADVTEPDDEDFIQDQRYFGKFLLSVGDLEQASSIFSSLVLLRNRQNTNGRFTDALVAALNDSAECFEKMGRLVSMKATIELLSQIRLPEKSA
jgi:tetratricopeptide (TPR) repeat protein